METLTKIKEMVESLSVDMAKFHEKARKTAQEVKSLCQDLRKEILEESKN